MTFASSVSTDPRVSLMRETVGGGCRTVHAAKRAVGANLHPPGDARAAAGEGDRGGGAAHDVATTWIGDELTLCLVRPAALLRHLPAKLLPLRSFGGQICRHHKRPEARARTEAAANLSRQVHRNRG